MPEISILSLLAMGFFGGGHCAGMCGPVSSAFVMQIPKSAGKTLLVLSLNLGRLASYCALGALAGAAAQLGSGVDSTFAAREALFVLSQFAVVLVGLYLMGASDWAMKIERAGAPLWRKRLGPLMAKVLPVRSFFGALAAGALWGLMPCGLVYSAALAASGHSGAVTGAVLMSAFWAGTLPNVLLMNYFAAKASAFFRNKIARAVAGFALICMAAGQTLWFFGMLQKPLFFI